MQAAALGPPRALLPGAWIIARREIRDQLRDWRILVPIIALTLFFPGLMNFTARQAMDFVAEYDAPIIAERLVPFLLMIVGFFPISISLVIALESFAGERERLSLEPLLATPLSDSQLYLGKMIASLLPPLGAAYLGIGVYLFGLWRSIGWTAPAPLLAQILILTTAQAVVMVSGAVVISSQTTSVRAANLLASFIIVPVSQLIIGESLIMFWGRYTVLWFIVVALLLVAAVLTRVGLHLFNRQELLAREIDVLDLRWLARTLWQGFRAGARTPWEWYAGVFRRTLPALKPTAALMALALTAAVIIGLRLAPEYPLPFDAERLESMPQTLVSQFESFGLMSVGGWWWILRTNLSAVALATVLGMFSFGVAAVILLMAPVAIVGYLAGSLALAGQNAPLYILGLVVPHGTLEVPAALLAGAAVIRLGLAGVSLPRSTSLGEAWLTSLAEWARVFVGLVVPLLIGAALLEVFVTPRVAVLLLGG
jgi:uncharacterized membrane protein SpoIIM required for sporulation